MAWTLLGTSTCPVRKTMDIRRSPATSLSCNSSPVRPGILTSSTRQHGPGCGARARNSRAEANASTTYPDDPSNRVRLLRTEGSSSTTNTSGETAVIGLSLPRGVHGQREMDGRPTLRVVRGPQSAAMRVDDGAHDGQAHP